MLLSCQAGKSWVTKQQWRAKSLNKQEESAEGSTGRSFHGSIISKQSIERALQGLDVLTTSVNLQGSGNEFQGLEHMIKYCILYSVFPSSDITLPESLFSINSHFPNPKELQRQEATREGRRPPSVRSLKGKKPRKL